MTAYVSRRHGSQYDIPGFIYFSKDGTDGIHGGIAIYVINNLVTHETIINSNVEVMCMDYHLHDKDISIVNVYNVPEYRLYKHCFTG